MVKICLFGSDLFGESAVTNWPERPGQNFLILFLDGFHSPSPAYAMAHNDSLGFASTCEYVL